MRLLLIALVALTATPALAENPPPSNYKWQVVRPGERISIRGNSYESESAGRDWSTLVASDGLSDITRFEVRRGDQWDGDKESGAIQERSEFDGYKQIWRAGTHIWGAYSFFIEPGATYRSDWAAISQMNGTKLRPFHIQFISDTFSVLTEHMVGSRRVVVPRTRQAVSRNSWHRVVFHLLEDASGSGRLEFWLDGRKIINFSGSIGAQDNEAYWKFGIYRGYGPISAPFAIQFANMEVGTIELLSRIEKPLEISTGTGSSRAAIE